MKASMLVTHRRVVLALAAGSFLIPARAAPASGVSAIKDLKPGDFIEQPELYPRGPVVLVVSLPTQLVHVYRNDVAIGASTCSTSKPSNCTPTGVFTIRQKRAEQYSSTYNNASMPSMQQLTWKGVALHAGNLPDHPASHACIRSACCECVSRRKRTTAGMNRLAPTWPGN
jgi:hypothetical protein